LLGGFDSTANHPSIILFPIALDLLLWLGPRLRVRLLINAMMEQLANLPGANTPETKDMLALSQEVWKVIAERANLFSALRSYPVGVTSLVNGQLPAAAPYGIPIGWEVNSGQMLLFWFLLTFVGLIFGSLFFGLITQAALDNKIEWGEEIRNLPFAALQVIWLALFLSILLLLISIPIGLVLSFIALFNTLISQIVLFVVSGLMLWLALPLLFSPHGIFINRLKMLASLMQGIRLIQRTLPKTSLFVLTALIINQGLDVLWRIPPETSWLALIGIAGHAFVSTGLLAASIIYYQAAIKWVQSIARPNQTQKI